MKKKYLLVFNVIIHVDKSIVNRMGHIYPLLAPSYAINEPIKCYVLSLFLCVSDRFTKMKQSGGYYVTVIEDTRISKLIGAATLTIEQKFIHNCSVVCQTNHFTLVV